MVIQIDIWLTSIVCVFCNKYGMPCNMGRSRGARVPSQGTGRKVKTKYSLGDITKYFGIVQKQNWFCKIFIIMAEVKR